MWAILKWFIGLIALIIVIYVFIFFLRSLFFDVKNVVTNNNITATSTLRSIGEFFANFSVANYMRNLRSYEYYPPIEVSKDVRNTYYRDDNYRDIEGDGFSFYTSDYQIRDPDDLKRNIHNFGNRNYYQNDMDLLFPSERIYNRGGNREGCMIAGCNMQLCVEANLVNNLQTPCEYNPKNACFSTAICERNRQNGRCSWRFDENLISCLKNY